MVTHWINGYTLDKDCVAVIKCKDHNEGRELAFEYFGDRFCTSYTVDQFVDKMKYFPRGLIEIN